MSPNSTCNNGPSPTGVALKCGGHEELFDTVVLPDGTVSDAWEQWLAAVEDEVAPALRRAIEMPTFTFADDDDDRERLARWVALQYQSAKCI